MSFIDRVRSAYSAFGKGDVPAILAMLDENVEWIGSGMADPRKNRTFKGKDGAGEFFQLVKETEKWSTFVPQRFIQGTDGRTVIVFGEARGISAPSNTEATWWFTHVFFSDLSGQLAVRVEAQWRPANPTLLDIVKAIYAAFGRGDIPAILAHVSPSVEWTASGMPNGTINKTFHGIQGVQNFFGEVAANTQWKSFLPKQFINGTDGRTIVVLGVTACLTSVIGIPAMEPDTSTQKIMCLSIDAAVANPAVRAVLLYSSLHIAAAAGSDIS